MNINDRLKEAFKNVAYSADRTWYNSFGSYQNANMGLYIREQRFRQETSKAETLKPRNVRDCIPTSKLAKYGNYEYGESREMSYSQAVTQFERLSEKFSNEPSQEPWMLEDVDDLFIGFVNYSKKDHFRDFYYSYKDQDNIYSKQISFESLYLQAGTFEEMDLKFKIVGSKKNWEESCYPFYWYQPIVTDKNLTLFKSPVGSYFVKNEDEKYKNFEWLNNIREAENTFSHLKSLSKSFEEQNTWIIKKDHLNLGWMDTAQQQDNVDISTNKRLYSAVLQGTSSSVGTKNNVMFFKHEIRTDNSFLGHISSLNTSLDAETSPISSLLLETNINNKSWSSIRQEPGMVLPSSTPPNQQINKKSIHGGYNTSLPINPSTPSTVITPAVNSSTYTPTVHSQTFQQQYFHNNSFLNSRLYSSNILQNTTASTALQTAHHNFIQNTFNFPTSSLPASPIIPRSICSLPSYHHASTLSFQRTAPSIGVPSIYSRTTAMNSQRPLQVNAPPVVVPTSSWFVLNNQQMRYISDRFRKFRTTTQPNTSANSSSIFQYKQNNINNNNRSLSERGAQIRDSTKIVKKDANELRCSITTLNASAQNSYPNTTSNNSGSTKAIESSMVLPMPLVEDGNMETNKDLDRIMTKTINAVLEESDPFVPVSSSKSDELEIQALEQYHSSSDNVFQELERLAAEQYDGNTNNVGPENCKNPPNRDIHGRFIFGGFVIHRTFLISNEANCRLIFKFCY